MNELLPLDAAAQLIRDGRALAIAGTESTLARLPAGRWIGGTIPYFMLPEGGRVVSDADAQVFVTDLTPLGNVSFAHFGADQLAGIAAGAPDNGFALTIIPAGSAAHLEFAANAASYPGAFTHPTVGWIAGVHLSDLGRTSPKVFDGTRAQALTDAAVVAYVELPAEHWVDVGIVNLFEPDDGDLLRFDGTAFNVGECSVNGERTNLAAYLRLRGVDHGRLPLVGDFAGAHVNVSVQTVNADTVDLYAPVFSGVDYRLARPVADYAAAFRARLSDTDAGDAVMGCNCILNFMFGNLEGRAIGGVAGPVTFGEIAYQLLNQTMVVIRVH